MEKGSDFGYCMHCNAHVVKDSSGEWTHSTTNLYTCNPKAEPRHQTVATVRVRDVSTSSR